MLYPDSLVACGFGVVAILFAVGAFVALGNVPSRGGALKNPHSYGEQKHESSSPVSASLDPPIELRNARNEFCISFLMAAGAFIAAFFLYRNPWFLWTRWISYPATALIVLLGTVLRSETASVRVSFCGRTLRLSSGKLCHDRHTTVASILGVVTLPVSWGDTLSCSTAPAPGWRWKSRSAKACYS